jgi:hypothetical protein
MRRYDRVAILVLAPVGADRRIAWATPIWITASIN